MSLLNERRRVKILFFGACARVVGTGELELVLAGSESEDVDSLITTIEEGLKGRLPYMVLCNGKRIREYRDNGVRLQDGDQVTVIPVTLGG